MVLLHNTGRFQSQKAINKLAYKWLGLYRIQEANNLKGTYFLVELDRITISGSIAENRLKRFYSQYLLIFNSEIEFPLNQPTDSRSPSLNIPMEIAIYPHSSLQPDVPSDLSSRKESNLLLSSVLSSSDREVEQESIGDKEEFRVHENT